MKQDREKRNAKAALLCCRNVWIVCLLLLVMLVMACPTSPIDSQEEPASEPLSADGSAEQLPSESLQEKTPETAPEPTLQEEPIASETVSEKQAEEPQSVEDTPTETIAETCHPASAVQPGDVVTEQGTVRGVKVQNTWVYKGIPYATPPIGALRWKPPQPHACWTDIKEARDFGDVCFQIDTKTKQPQGKEDCLTLNIWAPQTASPTNPLPVMFFIHGGGNIQGSSSETLTGGAPIYNGLYLAQMTDVVVVTLNYRLGALGYLALAELTAESTRQASGNYGLADQIFALRWVQRNIRHFGGAPQKVMIFGESAGAVDTCMLLTSPQAKGLFHAALMQSGSCGAYPLRQAEEGGKELLAQSPCANAADRLACLRALSGEDILKSMPGELGITQMKFGYHPKSFGPVVDGWLLPNDPLKTIGAKKHNDVPFVIGTNADEFHSLLAVPVPTKAAYESIIRLALSSLDPKDVQDVLTTYPADQYPTPRHAMVDLLSDAAFTCPARTIARTIASSQNSSVWRYFFTRHAQTAQGENPASHGVELLYVFYTLTDIPLYKPAQEDLTLANAMLGYWSRFAKTGNPHGLGSTVLWSPYIAQKDNYLQLDTPLQMNDGVHTQKCDLWDRLLAKLLP